MNDREGYYERAHANAVKMACDAHEQACIFKRRVAELEKALQPFVKKLEKTEKAHQEMGFPFDVADNKAFMQPLGGDITWGHLRRARNVLRKLND